MKKYPIGFSNNHVSCEKGKNEIKVSTRSDIPRKSVVQVYFPSRNMNLAYYNDKFDLRVGDYVYVEGKLEGQRGQVTEVNYSFKIKLSDYKRVISVIDTEIKGEFYFAGSHIVTFDKNVLNFEKVKAWFKSPEPDDEYVYGIDDELSFNLWDLDEMDIMPDVAERGFGYYVRDKVSFICVEGEHGFAIVEGTQPYEIEFFIRNGNVSNLTCSCYCSYNCKHEFATMLQLKDILEILEKNDYSEYSDYFAAISKEVFINNVFSKNSLQKIILK